MSAAQLSIDIIGPGPLGRALALRWQSLPRMQVGLWGRSGPDATPYVMLGAGGEVFAYTPTNGPFRIATVQGQEPPRLLFLTVKAFDVRGALQTWAPQLRPKRDVIVILSNGFYLDQIADLLEIYGEQVRLGTSFVGCKIMMEGRYQSRNWRDGLVMWGPATQGSLQEPGDQEKALLKLDSRAKWQNDIKVVLAQKWVMNTTLNSICAIYQLPSNGEALQKKAGLLRQVFAEACLHAQEIWLPGTQKDVGSFPTEEELWRQFLAVIAETQDNANSMYIDMLRGRKTEWAYLAGKCLAAPGSAMADLQLQAISMGLV